MHIRIATFLVAFAVGCGGGGGGGGGGGAPTGQALAKQIVETCGPDAFESLGGLLDAFFGLLNVADPLPDITVSGLVGDPATGFSWFIDFDGDMNPDVAGQVEFLDGTGVPISPVDLSGVPANPDSFAGLLAVVPDGSQLRIDFSSVSGAGGGTLTFLFEAGTAQSLSGQVTARSTACNAVFDFTAVPVLIWEIPAATLDILLDSADGRVEGTAQVDNSDVVVLTLTLNGEPTTLRFSLDLTTGVVTALP